MRVEIYYSPIGVPEEKEDTTQLSLDLILTKKVSLVSNSTDFQRNR